MHNLKVIVLLTFLIFIQTCLVAENSTECLFEEVKPGYMFNFPRDHGAHNKFPSEWWYFTGHLVDSDNNTYGFELTFFRVALKPCSNLESPWESTQLYIAHAALTDDKGRTFYHDQKMSRGNFNLANSSETSLDVKLLDWSAKMEDQKIMIKAESKKFALNLSLNSKKSLVFHGQNGYSQKLPGKKNASYYTSYTRLLGSGKIKIQNKEIQIKQAQAWMDHEIISSDVKDAKLGWDWFAIQLDDGRELMLYNLKYNNQVSQYSKGTLVQKDGSAEPLKLKDYQLVALSNWQSQKTEIKYPSTWEVNIPKLNLKLRLEPTVLDQELDSQSSTGKTYWEGRHLVYDSQTRKNLGSAYVELVGYDK